MLPVVCVVYADQKCVGVNGLPSLQRQGVAAGSHSSASETQAQVQAEFMEKEFVLLPDLKLRAEGRSVWETHHNNQLK